MKKPSYRNQRHFDTEQEREADRRDERTADIILFIIIAILLFSLIF